jgi:hypothetical protein
MFEVRYTLSASALDGPYCKECADDHKKPLFNPDDAEELVEYSSNKIMLHHDIAREIAQLLDRKRADYGVDNIRKFGSLGVMIRLYDKIARLENLLKKGAIPNFENLRDTAVDIAGYGVLLVIEIDRERR